VTMQNSIKERTKIKARNTIGEIASQGKDTRARPCVGVDVDIFLVVERGAKRPCRDFFTQIPD
jgi:hypothetical protein